MISRSREGMKRCETNIYNTTVDVTQNARLNSGFVEGLQCGLIVLINLLNSSSTSHGVLRGML